MNSLFASLLQSAAFLGLFYGVYWLFLRKETYFTLNRIFLLSAGGLSLLLPFIRIPSPFFQTVVQAPPANFTFPAGGEALSVSSPLRPLVMLYLTGVAFFLILFLVRLFRLALAVRRCDCRYHHGLRVVLCPGWSESFSFFRTIFLDRSRMPEDEFERVLAHEMAHVHQAHSLDIILMELIAIIQWFNPFVWPYKKSLRETHEYLADRAVVAQGCSRSGYQLLIVEQHVGGKLFEFASNFRNSQIKRRLMMLSRHESKGWARLKILLVLPAALALVLVFAEPRTVFQAGPQDTVAAQSQAESHASEPSEEEVLAALKAKWEKLEIMKKENEAKFQELKKAYNETQDEAKKEEILALIKEQKKLSWEIGQKERYLQLKKMELALKSEMDPAKKEALIAKYEHLKQQSEEDAKKMQALKEAQAAKEKDKEAKGKKNN